MKLKKYLEKKIPFQSVKQTNKINMPDDYKKSNKKSMTKFEKLLALWMYILLIISLIAGDLNFVLFFGFALIMLLLIGIEEQL